MQRRPWAFLIACAYVLSIFKLGGLQDRHILMASLVGLDYYNPRTRSFLRFFFPFMLTGIVYDAMRYFYWQGIEGHIHVVEPYELEKKLFGINYNGKIITPNEFFEIKTYTLFDFLCGFAYITFVAEYLISAFLLFFTGRLKTLWAFGRCFFLVNLLGFITYFIYPAAPPWYITKYGLGPALMHIPSSSAAAVRFDQLMGTHFFDTMYGNAVDIYGAYPSLHVAYPLLVAWSALICKRFRGPTILFYFLMCFSAVYLQHHYIVDIILGTVYSVVALIAVRGFQERKTYRRTKNKLKWWFELVWPTQLH